MQTNKKRAPQQGKKNKQEIVGYKMPLGKINFFIMGIAAIMIVVGFILISGGGTDDGSFNPEVFNSTRIVIGPALAFLGFIGVGVGIMWKGKDNGHN